MGVKIAVELPDDVLREVDRIVEMIGFGEREEFLKAAVRRTVDHYKLCIDRVL